MNAVTWFEAAERVTRTLAESLPEPQARGEAWRVTAALGGVDLGFLLPGDMRATIPPQRWASMEPRIRRLEAGEPSAYVLGMIPFHEVQVAVDPRALIPRPETEVLVEHVLRWCREQGLNAPRLLELGTGSGCIAKALARALPRSRVTATDICPQALALAARNSRDADLEGRIRFVRADWLEWTRGLWDVLVSNPPYIPTAMLPTLPQSVSSWEPRNALDGGPDGFMHLARIIRTSVSCLAPGGLLALELSPELGERAISLARMSGFSRCCIVKDLAGRDRILSATLEKVVQ